MSDIRNTRIATIALFHVVARNMLEITNAEMNNHAPRSVLSHLTTGQYIAMIATITINKPTTQVFVAELPACGQMNVEMNSHAPSTILTKRGHTDGPGAGGITDRFGTGGRVVVG
jgi:hypothetical protein